MGASLRTLNPRAPIQLEVEALTSTAESDASHADPISVSVQCTPTSEGEECDVAFEVQVTLTPSMAEAVRFKQVTTKEGKRVMTVASVKEDSEAFRRGMRVSMTVKSL